VLARLDFARGTRYLQFLWGPRVRLWNVRELRGPDGVELFPESASALFSYTPSTGGVRRVEVTRGAAGMEALVLHAPSGPVRAVRGDPAPRTSAGQPR
jgi:hypothetical protein